jgi:hypothetical protein
MDKDNTVDTERSEPLVTLNEDVYDLPEDARINLVELIEIEREFGPLP